MEKITDINIFFDKLIQRRLYILDKKLKSAYRVLFEVQKEEKFLRNLLLLKEKENTQKNLRKNRNKRAKIDNKNNRNL